MRREITFALLLCYSGILFCQERKEGEFPEKVMELICELSENGEIINEDTGEEISEIVEFYRGLLSSPMDINSAEREDLRKLMFLNDFQIESILDYRKEYGNLISLNELRQIPGIEKSLADLLIPFISTGGTNGERRLTPSSMLKDGRYQLITRLRIIPEKQYGFTPITESEFEKHPDSRYLGSPGNLYSQFRYEYSNIFKCALTLEKDPGERGVDYKAFNVALYNRGIIDRIVAGDFCARSGQGLVLWNSFAMSTYTQPLSAHRSEMGITPYNSTDENRSLSGAGTTLRFGRMNLSLLISSRGYDARIVDSSYTSLIKTGLHNTTTTFSRKRALKGTLLASNLSYTGEKLKLSQTIAVYRYNLPYGGKDSLRASKEDGQGRWGGNIGLAWYKVAGRIRMFGEAAIDHGGSHAFIGGIICSHGGKAESILLFRDYSKNYWAPYSGAISAGSSPRNERGVRLAASLLIGKYTKGTASAEFLRDYRNITLTLNHTPERGLSHGLRLVNTLDKSSVRYSIGYKVTPSVTVIHRGDLVCSYKKEKLTGYQLYTEIIYKPFSKIADASARIAYFNTPGWDVRIYSYEKDMLYNFTLPVNYGRGLKWYINLHIPLLRSIDLWFKISRIRYFDRLVIGDGNDKIEGATKSEIKMQLRFRF